MHSALLVARLLLLGVLLLAATTLAAESKETYSIAVIPSAPPAILHTQWTPFLERLSRETGYSFRLKLYQKMAEFERDIWSGVPDFIFSSPIQTVVAHQSSGYKPLLRGSKDIAVGLFVRKDSPIRSIDDLSGRKISYVGNKNLCSVFIRHLLGKQGNKAFYGTEYAGSTRSVIISVLLGKNDAGAVFLPELEKESQDTRSQLREILVTPEIAPHPLSVHPRVPRPVYEAIRKTVLSMDKSQEGSEILATIRIAAPKNADYKRDYSRLEEIDIRGLTNWGQ